MFKKLSAYIFTLLPIIALAQAPETFTINGRLDDVKKPLKVYLNYPSGNQRILDSAILANGNFQFNGKVAAPVGAILVLDHKGVGFKGVSKTDDILNFYVDKGNIIIAGDDSIARARISGSAINSDNEILNAMLAPVYKQAQALYAEAQAAKPDQQQSPVFQNTMQDRFKAIQKDRERTLKIYIANHPNSYLSLMAISSMGGPSADVNEIEPLYNGLSQTLKDTEAGKQLKESFAPLKATALGTLAPDFTQNDVDGKPVKLSSFKGKYVLLDFWASWCGPCRQENPNVVRVYNKYKTKNFTVLGVSLDRPNGKADWLKAIKDDGLTWTHVSDLKYWNNAAAGLYFVQSIPQNYLIDPQGKIVAKNLRGADLEAKLIELLGKI
jgi:peroxiredoxin